MTTPSSDNVFTAPLEDDDPLEPGGKDQRLAAMPWKTLKRLHADSTTINTMIGVWFLWALLVVLFFLWFQQVSEAGLPLLGLLFAAVLGLVPVIAAVGCFSRSRWAGVLGVVTCSIGTLLFVLMLFGGFISIIGLVVAITGLVAFSRNQRQLFGRDRLTHREIKRAFKAAKAARKQGTA